MSTNWYLACTECREKHRFIDIGGIHIDLDTAQDGTLRAFLWKHLHFNKLVITQEDSRLSEKCDTYIGDKLYWKAGADEPYDHAQSSEGRR